MGALLIYLLKSSLMLALSVVLFMLLMRRETFHGINRVLLLAVVAAPGSGVGDGYPYGTYHGLCRADGYLC